METSPQDRDIERQIMECLRPVVRELLLVEPAEIVAFLKFDKHQNVSDIIDSATEQYFAPDFLAYREAGTVNLDWQSSLSIELQMVINAPSHAFEFLLCLDKDKASVSLNTIRELPGLTNAETASAALSRSIRINSVRI